MEGNIPRCGLALGSPRLPANIPLPALFPTDRVCRVAGVGMTPMAAPSTRRPPLEGARPSRGTGGGRGRNRVCWFPDHAARGVSGFVSRRLGSLVVPFWEDRGGVTRGSEMGAARSWSITDPRGEFGLNTGLRSGARGRWGSREVSSPGRQDLDCSRAGGRPVGEVRAPVGRPRAWVRHVPPDPESSGVDPGDRG